MVLELKLFLAGPFYLKPPRAGGQVVGEWAGPPPGQSSRPYGTIDLEGQTACDMAKGGDLWPTLEPPGGIPGPTVTGVSACSHESEGFVSPLPCARRRGHVPPPRVSVKAREWAKQVSTRVLVQALWPVPAEAHRSAVAVPGENAAVGEPVEYGDLSVWCRPEIDQRRPAASMGLKLCLVCRLLSADTGRYTSTALTATELTEVAGGGVHSNSTRRGQ
ncbi:hypothetical protein AAFF_G00001690 [Aldrovandia affinis]|uniref:Uncharacterized protein n=1 Tax=Aldrovandia affinis TaxID=143900 RepID=A0AAD7TCY0_9TELE|nr:hypothetical protein AAFF_G00001690 [Aldrovandia affinis]